MIDAKKNGDMGAYPLHADLPLKHLVQQGITKRELFAAMAMQGMLSSLGDLLDYTGKDIAERAVYQADDLLSALEEGKK